MTEQESISTLTEAEILEFGSIGKEPGKWKRPAKRIATLLNEPGSGEPESKKPIIVGYYTGFTDLDTHNLSNAQRQQAALSNQVRRRLQELKRSDRLYSSVRIAKGKERPGYWIVFSLSPIPKPEEEETEGEFFLARAEIK